MASVFSYYVVSFHSSSDPSDQLTQSPRAGHNFASAPDSSLTTKLTRLFIATTAKPCIRNAPHPFVEPRQMTPTDP